ATPRRGRRSGNPEGLWSEAGGRSLTSARIARPTSVMQDPLPFRLLPGHQAARSFPRQLGLGPVAGSMQFDRPRGDEAGDLLEVERGEQSEAEQLGAGGEFTRRLDKLLEAAEWLVEDAPGNGLLLKRRGDQGDRAGPRADRHDRRRHTATLHRPSSNG